MIRVVRLSLGDRFGLAIRLSLGDRFDSSWSKSVQNHSPGRGAYRSTPPPSERFEAERAGSDLQVSKNGPKVANPRLRPIGDASKRPVNGSERREKTNSIDRFRAIHVELAVRERLNRGQIKLRASQNHEKVIKSTFLKGAPTDRPPLHLSILNQDLIRKLRNVTS